MKKSKDEFTIKKEKILLMYFIFLIWRPHLNENIYGRLGVRLIDLIVFLVGATLLIIFYRTKKSREVFTFILLLLLFGLSMAVSLSYSVFCLNYQLIIRDFFQFYRIPFNFLLIYLGYTYGVYYNLNKIKKIILYSGISQSLLSMFQMFNLFNINNWMNLIYSTEKTRDFTTAIKTTGTFDNGNTFGLFINIYLIFLIFCNDNLTKKQFTLGFSIGLLALISSRSKISLLFFIMFISIYLIVNSFSLLAKKK